MWFINSSGDINSDGMDFVTSSQIFLYADCMIKMGGTFSIKASKSFHTQTNYFSELCDDYFEEARVEIVDV